MIAWQGFFELISLFVFLSCEKDMPNVLFSYFSLRFHCSFLLPKKAQLNVRFLVNIEILYLSKEEKFEQIKFEMIELHVVLPNSCIS